MNCSSKIDYLYERLVGAVCHVLEPAALGAFLNFHLYGFTLRLPSHNNNLDLLEMLENKLKHL